MTLTPIYVMNIYYSYFPFLLTSSPLMDTVTLLNWCSANGVRIHPNLRILHDENRGICVHAADCHIIPEQSLVVIPKSAVLSAPSCELADHISYAPYGHDATLTLALALYSEQCVLIVP